MNKTYLSYFKPPHYFERHSAFPQHFAECSRERELTLEKVLDTLQSLELPKLLFRHSDKSSITQEKRLAISL